MIDRKILILIEPFTRKQLNKLYYATKSIAFLHASYEFWRVHYFYLGHALSLYRAETLGCCDVRTACQRWTRRIRRSVLLTDSTKSIAHQPLRVLPDPPVAPRCYCRSALSRSVDPFVKTLAPKSMRIEPVFKVSLYLQSKHAIYLCGDVCNGGFGDKAHAMNPRIARSCCLWLLIDRAGRREDVLECL